MKTKRILTVLAGVLAVSQMAFAQASIDRIAEELEQKGVECDKVVSRNPKTKKMVSMVKSYEFRSKDGNYAEQLKKAFEKEAENATTEITESGGRERILIFDTDDCHMVYVLEIGKQTPDPKVELNIIIDYNKKKSKGTSNIKIGDVSVFSIPDFDVKDFRDRMKQFDFDMKDFDFDLEKFNLDLQKYGIDIEKYRREAEKAEKKYRKQFDSPSEKDKNLTTVVDSQAVRYQ